MGKSSGAAVGAGGWGLLAVDEEAGAVGGDAVHEGGEGLHDERRAHHQQQVAPATHVHRRARSVSAPALSHGAPRVASGSAAAGIPVQIALLIVHVVRRKSCAAANATTASYPLISLPAEEFTSLPARSRTGKAIEALRQPLAEEDNVGFHLQDKS